jgi:hypothetical protein
VATATRLMWRQHRRIEQLLSSLQSDRHLRNRLLLEVIGALTTHLVVEESLLYPMALRSVGLSLREQSSLHRRMRAMLSELTSPGISGEAFGAKVDVLATTFAAHALLDESAVYPVLVRHLDATELDELGDDMEAMSASLIARARPYVRSTRPSGLPRAASDATRW